MSNAPPTLLTTIEAAKIVRLSPAKLQQLRFKGGGPRYMKVGRGNSARVLYSMDDLKEWMGQTFGSTSEAIGSVADASQRP